jgi:hypothetical protein
MSMNDNRTEKPIVETPVQARQGFLDRPVLAVLVGGVVLVLIAFVISYFVAV